MLSEKIDLLPCPFCGGNGELDDWILADGDFAEGAIVCAKCGTQGPFVSCIDINSKYFDFTAGEPLENAAKHEWNTRADNQFSGTVTKVSLPKVPLVVNPDSDKDR